MGIDWLVSPELRCEGRRWTLQRDPAKGLTHARTHARRERTSMRIDARRTSRRAENGSYCYGHYLPLIRTGGGRFSCECMRQSSTEGARALRTDV